MQITRAIFSPLSPFPPLFLLPSSSPPPPLLLPILIHHCPDNEFLVAPQDAELSDGDTLTFECVHRFGIAYAWRANQTHIYRGNRKARFYEGGQRLQYGPVDFSDHLVGLYCIVHTAIGHFFVSPPGRMTVSCELLHLLL